MKPRKRSCSFFSNNDMYILHQNIAGLINKSELLSVCLDELMEKNIEVDILCITEHFMMAGYEKYLVIPNYSLAASYSRNDKNVAVLVFW